MMTYSSDYGVWAREKRDVRRREEGNMRYRVRGRGTEEGVNRGECQM